MPIKRDTPIKRLLMQMFFWFFFFLFYQSVLKHHFAVEDCEWDFTIKEAEVLPVWLQVLTSQSHVGNENGFRCIWSVGRSPLITPRLKWLRLGLVLGKRTLTQKMYMLWRNIPGGKMVKSLWDLYKNEGFFCPDWKADFSLREPRSILLSVCYGWVFNEKLLLFLTSVWPVLSELHFYWAVKWK